MVVGTCARKSGIIGSDSCADARTEGSRCCAVFHMDILSVLPDDIMLFTAAHAIDKIRAFAIIPLPTQVGMQLAKAIFFRSEERVCRYHEGINIPRKRDIDTFFVRGGESGPINYHSGGTNEKV